MCIRDSARSASKNLTIQFVRNSQPANYSFNNISIDEDNLTQSLDNYITAIPQDVDDEISFRILNLPSNFSLINAEHVPYESKGEDTSISFENLSDVYIKPPDNISGKFEIDYQIVSTPPLGGQQAFTDTITLSLNILGIADILSLIHI